MFVPKSKQVKIPDKIDGKKILTGIWKKRQIEYVENELVIRFKDEKSNARELFKKLQLKELKGSKAIRDFDKRGEGLLHVDGDVLKMCELLRKKSEISFVEPNIVDHAAITVPNDTNYAAQQWPLPLIGMPDAWDVEQGNSNVMIAIVDSGIPMSGTPSVLSHPDLNDASRIILGSNLVNGTSIPRDDFGHGTHVAGIASAESDNATGISGVSWNSLLYIVKVFDGFGSGTSQRFYDAVIEAVDYAEAHSLRLVINYSGGGGEANLKEQAVIYAHDHNALIVAAAGNDNGGSVIWPAAYSASYENVIAVSATDSADALAGYSNVGPEVNVSAPGSNIYSCMPNYAVYMTTTWGFSQNYDHMDGTSMASPHVAGLAALLLSYSNSLTASEVRHIIEDNVVDLGSAGWDQSFGFGRIDAHAALDSLVPVVVCPWKTEGPCLYKVEACTFSEYCLYVTEHMGCYYKKDLPCLFIKETGTCQIIKEVCPSKEIACTKIELICPKMEGCLKESLLGCMKELTVIEPWGDIFIKKGDPLGDPFIIKRNTKHVKPLTRVRRITRKRFVK